MAFLARGFGAHGETARFRKKFRTTVHSSGRCYLPNLDGTTEVLAIAEGEQFK